jgi:hypothetical protein
MEKTEIVGKAWRQVIAVFEKPESAGDASLSPKPPTWSNRKFDLK